MGSIYINLFFSTLIVLKIKMLDFDEEIRELERDFIVNLINYLETGVFQNKSNKNFV